MKTNQIFSGQIILDKDELADHKWIRKLVGNICTIYRQLSNSVFEIELNNHVVKLIFKNITYLGKPHPIHKKRFQISQKDILQMSKSNVLVVGLYLYRDLEIFCIVPCDQFLNRQTKNSSIHINIGSLLRASKMGIYSELKENGQSILYLKYAFFKLFINQYTRKLSAIDTLYSQRKYIRKFKNTIFDNSLESISTKSNKIKDLEYNIQTSTPTIKRIIENSVENKFVYFDGIHFCETSFAGIKISGKLEILNHIFDTSFSIYKDLQKHGFNTLEIYDYLKENFYHIIDLNSSDIEFKNPKMSIMELLKLEMRNLSDRSLTEEEINNILKKYTSSKFGIFKEEFIRKNFAIRVLYGRPLMYYLKNDPDINDPSKIGINSMPNYIIHLVKNNHHSDIFSIYSYLHNIAPKLKIKSFLQSLSQVKKALINESYSYSLGHFRLNYSFKNSEITFFKNLAEAIELGQDLPCLKSDFVDSPFMSYIRHLKLIDVKFSNFLIEDKIIDGQFNVHSKEKDESLILAFLFSQYSIRFSRSIKLNGQTTNCFYSSRFDCTYE